ncbi:MAG: BlaI/MecI/CopY family transcriptional regulator [bacterium]
MKRRAADPLSHSEWKVMKIVWQLKSCAARDVYARAGEQYGWSPKTVRTFLNRLVVKGFLKTKQIGNCYVYSPARSVSQSLFKAADDLLDKSLASQAGPLINYIIQKSELSPEDIQGLRQLLDEYDDRE